MFIIVCKPAGSFWLSLPVKLLVLNTLVENPVVLALQASNGSSLMKDNGFEKSMKLWIEKIRQRRFKK